MKITTSIVQDEEIPHVAANNVGVNMTTTIVKGQLLSFDCKETETAITLISLCQFDLSVVVDKFCSLYGDDWIGKKLNNFIQFLVREKYVEDQIHHTVIVVNNIGRLMSDLDDNCGVETIGEYLLDNPTLIKATKASEK